MAKRFGASTTIDRPIEAVFDYLAEGTNDPEFSPRVQEIEKTTDGPVGVGTIFESTVRDAGMTTQRKLEITEFERPTSIRWTERSKNLVTAASGGYDLTAEGTSTRLEFHNELEGHGFGKLILPLAVSGARKDAEPFAERIKTAAEARIPQ